MVSVNWVNSIVWPWPCSRSSASTACKLASLLSGGSERARSSSSVICSRSSAAKALRSWASSSSASGCSSRVSSSGASSSAFKSSASFCAIAANRFSKVLRKAAKLLATRRR